MKQKSFKNPTDILGIIVKSFEDVGKKKVRVRITKDFGKPINKSQSVISKEKAISSFISLPQFKKYKLKPKDVMVIAFLWRDFLENYKPGITLRDICSRIKFNILETNKCLDFFESLLERKILRLETRRSKASKLSPINMLTCDYHLSSELMMKILDRDLKSVIEKRLALGWNNDKEFLYDLHRSLDYLYSTHEEFEQASDLYPDDVNSDLFYQTLEPIIKKLSHNKNRLNINGVIKKYSFNETEIHIILLIIYLQVCKGDDISSEAILKIISRDTEEYQKNSSIFEKDSRLFKEEVLEETERNMFDDEVVLRLKLDFVKQLSKQKEEEQPDSTKLTVYLKKVKAFEVIKTEQRIDNLILPEEDKTLLETFVMKNKNPQHFDLTDWGFGAKVTGNSERHKGFIGLFYGYPGTGKTYAACAVANELSKDIISIDCTKLHDCYYGESEKLVKKAFRMMSKMSVEMQNPPVFLINEADQLIYSREKKASYTSKVENKIQNIILQEMENFAGILILTTNMDQMIDEAYFRRFNLKMRFNLPDYECRRQLWALHLSPNIPGYQNIDINYLAKHYEFTGGQISLVIQNACTEAIVRKGKKRELTMEDLIRYSDLELPWQKEKVNDKKSIGF